MTDPNLFRLRVVFAKQGRLAMLSHLEVARALERAVRRADLPFAVSNGFSPHMRIAFGAALPVGVGGTDELFDLLLLRYVPPQKALAALQAASVPDLMVKSCAYIEPRAKAASVAFPFSSYRAELSRAPESLPLPAQLRIERKKKTKVLEVVEFLVGEPSLSGRTVEFTLEAKPTGSMRPDVFLRRCCELADVEAPAAGGAAAEDADGAVLLRVENGDAAAVAAGGSVDAGPLSVVSLTRTAQRELPAEEGPEGGAERP